MRKTLLIFVFLNTLICFAQSNKIQFEYNKQIVSGKLKTSLNNLQEYIVVKNDKNEELNFNIAQLKDIVINGESFVAAKVLNDGTLTRNITFLDHLSEPNYNENWLLLKVLVNGDYKLYQYSSSIFSQFYYKDNNTNEIKPLVYKEYIIGSSVKKNNHFRSQLRKDVPLYFYKFKDYEKLEYKYDDLRKYFNKLNGYEESEGIEKMNVKLSVFGGFFNNFQDQLYLSPAAINSLYLKDYDFEKNTVPLLGISGEIFINKEETQAFFIEAGFTQYKTDYYLDYYSAELSKINFEFQTSIILFNLGYKQYFNLSANSQLYASGSFATNFFFTSKNEVRYDFENYYNQVLKRDKNFSNVGGRVALGYKFKKHYFIEADYHFGFSMYYEGGSYNMTSFKLGYSF